jgi:hypothetical protein
MKSDQSDLLYEFTKVKITKDRSSTSHSLLIDSLGKGMQELDPGQYKLEIHYFEAPELAIDTLIIGESENHYLEIKLGELPKYQMVHSKK